MKDIFSDLYDRVLSFFTSQNQQDDSKIVAKNRLRTVLMQDRVGFSERAMQMLKDDLINSISKYLEINTECFDLSIDGGNNITVLNLSIPVIRTKTDEEIDEAISEAQKENIEKTQEIVGEIEELVKEKVQKLAEQQQNPDNKGDEQNKTGDSKKNEEKEEDNHEVKSEETKSENK